MFGKSWGGFNGLQVAFCQPKALKAVVSIYSTGEGNERERERRAVECGEERMK
jgi:predicted acyl esterase